MKEIIWFRPGSRGLFVILHVKYILNILSLSQLIFELCSTRGLQAVRFSLQMTLSQSFCMNFQMISTLILRSFLKFDSLSDYEQFICKFWSRHKMVFRDCNKMNANDLNSQAPDVPELAHQDLFQLSRLSGNCCVKMMKK